MAEIPKVAVVVAAYNAEATVVAAVESILAGTQACRVYVVDDCSRKPVADCLKHLLDRIVVIRLDKNAGPAAARNVAIERILEAGFEYVAIADADDISCPERLEKQLAFMEANPRIGVCGTWTRDFRFDINEPNVIRARPASPEAVRNMMYFNIGISHPSAMIRADVLRRVGLYSSKYPVAEDYELFRRIGVHYEFANIPELLLHCRISPNGQSESRPRRQIYDRFVIQLKYLEPTNWRAWAGLGKTFVTFFIPRGILAALKLNLVRSHVLHRRA